MSRVVAPCLRRHNINMHDADKSTFDALIGQDFIVALDGGETIALTLSDVFEKQTGAPAANIDGDALRQTAIQLTLRGPAAPVLSALTYPVTIPGHGTHHLFLSAFEAGRTAVNYDIVFS